MAGRMGVIERGEIGFNRIQTFAQCLVCRDIRRGDREWLLEFGPLVHQLDRVPVGSRRVMPLKLPTGNHPTTSIEGHSDEIGFHGDGAFRGRKRGT